MSTILISTSATPQDLHKYKWYTHTGQRKIKLEMADSFMKLKANSHLNDPTFEIYPDDVFGIKQISKTGEARCVLLEDPSISVVLSAKSVANLNTYVDNGRFKPYKGKISNVVPPISKTKAKQDSSNPDAYNWHEYKSDRGYKIRDYTGKEIGVIRKTDKFGVMDLHDDKTYYFMADAAIQDPSFSSKAVQIQHKMFSTLIQRSSPIKAKPIKPIKPDTARPEVVPTSAAPSEPTAAPINGMPNVVHLKQLNVKTSTIVKKLKDISKIKILSEEDYENVKAQLFDIRETDNEELKAFMHEIAVKKEMATVVMTLLKSSWDSCISTISAKRNAIRARQVEAPEVIFAPGKSGPMTIGLGDEAAKSPDEIYADRAQALKDKASEITLATNAQEVQMLLDDLKRIYAKAKEQIQEATANNKKKRERLISSLDQLYLKKSMAMQAKLNLYNTPLDEDEGTEWNDDIAETPTDDFSPVDKEESEPEEVTPAPAPAQTQAAKAQEVLNALTDDKYGWLLSQTDNTLTKTVDGKTGEQLVTARLSDNGRYLFLDTETKKGVLDIDTYGKTPSAIAGVFNAMVTKAFGPTAKPKVEDAGDKPASKETLDALDRMFDEDPTDDDGSPVNIDETDDLNDPDDMDDFSSGFDDMSGFETGTDDDYADMGFDPSVGIQMEDD